MPKTKDENELAKSLIDDIIAETESEDWDKPVNKVARLGGEARAAKLTPAERSAIAKKAAQSRWKGSESDDS
jgi:hypothetical protein